MIVTVDAPRDPGMRRYPEVTVKHSPAFNAGVSETINCFDAREFHRVHRGEIAAYVARGVFSAEQCHRVEEAFLRTKNLYQYDVRPIIEAIGNPLFRAESPWRDHYFLQAAVFRQQIQTLFENAGTPNFVEQIVQLIAQHFRAYGIAVRPIRYAGKIGFYGITRRWGAYDVDDLGNATRIHEDRTQLKSHLGLETASTAPYVFASTCIYYCNGNSGGDLSVYDVRPSMAQSASEETDRAYKYGYSSSLIANARCIRLCPRAGDVITFFADHMHAVAGIRGGNRINSSFFSGVNELDRSLLVWS